MSPDEDQYECNSFPDQALFGSQFEDFDDSVLFANCQIQPEEEDHSDVIIPVPVTEETLTVQDEPFLDECDEAKTGSAVDDSGTGKSDRDSFLSLARAGKDKQLDCHRLSKTAKNCCQALAEAVNSHYRSDYPDVRVFCNICKQSKWTISVPMGFGFDGNLYQSQNDRTKYVFKASQEEDSVVSGRDVNKLLRRPMEKRLKCEKCYKSFCKKYTLEKHMKAYHSVENPFKCEVCGKTYQYKGTLKKHMETDHLKLRYDCNYCGRPYTQKGHLRTHIQMHHLKETRFKCEQCDHISSSPGRLKRHIEAVHQKKRHFCQECGTSFSTDYTLNSHIKAKHSKESPYKCKKCGKKLSTSKALQLHVKAIHLNERHQCKDCQKSFSGLDAMRRHMKVIHSVGKQYNCDHCGKIFASNYQIKQHISEVHLKERKFVCNFCNKAFSQKVNLVKHIKKCLNSE